MPVGFHNLPEGETDEQTGANFANVVGAYLELRRIIAARRWSSVMAQDQIVLSCLASRVQRFVTDDCVPPKPTEQDSAEAGRFASYTPPASERIKVNG